MPYRPVRCYFLRKCDKLWSVFKKKGEIGSALLLVGGIGGLRSSRPWPTLTSPVTRPLGRPSFAPPPSLLCLPHRYRAFRKPAHAVQ